LVIPYTTILDIVYEEKSSVYKLTKVVYSTHKTRLYITVLKIFTKTKTNKKFSFF